MVEVAVIGLLAGLLTTGSQVPQAIKVYKTRSTADLSGLWISILFVGTVVWLYYGLLISDLPLIIWNGFSIFTLGYIAVHKFNIIKNEKRVADMDLNPHGENHHVGVNGE